MAGDRGSRRRAPSQETSSTTRLLQQIAAERERRQQGLLGQQAGRGSRDIATAAAEPLPDDDLEDSSEIESDEPDDALPVRKPAAAQQPPSSSTLLDQLLRKVAAIDLTRSSDEEASDGADSAPQATRRPTQPYGSASEKEHRKQRGTSPREGPASEDAAGAAPPATAAAVTQQAAEKGPDDMLLEGGFKLPGVIASKLYPHQVQGVRWLWSLHKQRRGGILADDMGLGKTMQCSAFLAGALRPGVAHRCLIIAPKTLLDHWSKELATCGLGRRTFNYYTSSTVERRVSLAAVTGRGGVLLTTYGMVLHNAQSLVEGLGDVTRDEDLDEDEDEQPDWEEEVAGSLGRRQQQPAAGGTTSSGDEGGGSSGSAQPKPRRRIRWDYIILDEGHKIKNPHMQLSQRLRLLRANVRVIISGTPIQNHLGDLHALLGFACPGLLGSSRHFKQQFEKPIAAGSDRKAGERQRQLAAAKAAELRALVAPFVLRREKKEVLTGPAVGAAGSETTTLAAAAASGATTSSSAVAALGGPVVASASARTGPATAGPVKPANLPPKVDLVVWLRLQPLQQHVYELFLHSDAVKAALNSSKSPLAALTVLKKVCDHPALLSKRAADLVVAAGAQWNKKGNQKDGAGAAATGTSSSSRGRGGAAKNKKRNSLDDFIVDDDDEGSGSEVHSEASSSDGSYKEDDGEAGSSDGEASEAGRRGAAVSEVLNQGFSSEFQEWAGGGADVEALLLKDLAGARGAEASCKVLLVGGLLAQLRGQGHRTLVFSQSRVMLDLLEAGVKGAGLSYCRIDGSSSLEERRAQVAAFQAPGATVDVFLLTSQVGGLGLTLTAADRVVIVDPSWNPAQDSQSVDRAYRIGQTRPVVVYRLITCGTVEEKIYRKQVYKAGLSRTGMEEGVQQRYFTHQELHELFKLDPPALRASETQALLQQLHGNRRSRDPALLSHLAWLESLPVCAGTSDHGLLFSDKDPEGVRLEVEGRRVAAAEGLGGAGGAGGAGAGGATAGAYRGAGGGGGRRSGNKPGGVAVRRQGVHVSINYTQGWKDGGGAASDATELHDLMAGMSLAGPGRGSAAAPSNPYTQQPATASSNSSQSEGWHQQQHQQQQQREEARAAAAAEAQWAALAARRQQVAGALEAQRSALQQLGPRLADGGAKLRKQCEELQQQLAALDQQAAALGGAAGAATTPALATPTADSAPGGASSSSSFGATKGSPSSGNSSGGVGGIKGGRGSGSQWPTTQPLPEQQNPASGDISGSSRQWPRQPSPEQQSPAAPSSQQQQRQQHTWQPPPAPLQKEHQQRHNQPPPPARQQQQQQGQQLPGPPPPPAPRQQQQQTLHQTWQQRPQPQQQQQQQQLRHNQQHSSWPRQQPPPSPPHESSPANLRTQQSQPQQPPPPPRSAPLNPWQQQAAGSWQGPPPNHHHQQQQQQQHSLSSAAAAGGTGLLTAAAAAAGRDSGADGSSSSSRGSCLLDITNGDGSSNQQLHQCSSKQEASRPAAPSPPPPDAVPGMSPSTAEPAVPGIAGSSTTTSGNSTANSSGATANGATTSSSRSSADPQPVQRAGGAAVRGAVTWGGSPATLQQLLQRKSVLKRQLLADTPLVAAVSRSSPGGRAKLAAFKAMKQEYREIKGLLAAQPQRQQ